MVALLLLYPTLSAVRLVGTDLVQAVPLVLSAAISHVLVSGVEWAVLIPLILGGSPGTFLGARLANWVSQSVIRRGIVIVLTLTGLNMLGVPPEMVGIIGAGLLLLGPLAWGFIRQTRGLPAFDNNAAAWRPAPKMTNARAVEPVETDEPRRWLSLSKPTALSAKADQVVLHLVVRRQQARPPRPRPASGPARPCRTAASRAGGRRGRWRASRCASAGSRGCTPCSRPGA